MTQHGTTQPSGWFREQQRNEYPLRRGQNVPRSIFADLSLSVTEQDIWIDSLVVDRGLVSLVFNNRFGIALAFTNTNTQHSVVYELEGDQNFASVVFGLGIQQLIYKSTRRIEIYPSCIQSTFAKQQLIHRRGFEPANQTLRFAGSTDVAVRHGFMDADNQIPAVFFGLNTNEQGDELHEKYLGACDRRPAMGNCGENNAINSISGVQPDCCNTIHIELQGVNIHPIDNACGVVVESEFTLEEACPERSLQRLIEREDAYCDPSVDPDTLVATDPNVPKSVLPKPPVSGQGGLTPLPIVSAPGNRIIISDPLPQNNPPPTSPDNPDTPSTPSTPASPSGDGPQIINAPEESSDP